MSHRSRTRGDRAHPAAAAAGHRRLPAIWWCPLRGPSREVHPLRSSQAMERRPRARALRPAQSQDRRSDARTTSSRSGTLGTSSTSSLPGSPNGTVKVLVEGKRRVRGSLDFVQENDEFFLCDGRGRRQRIRGSTRRSDIAEALVRSVHKAFEGYVKLNKKVPPEMVSTSSQSIDRGAIAARRHDRRPPEPQARRQAGDPRDRPVPSRATGGALRRVDAGRRSRSSRSSGRSARASRSRWRSSQKEYYLNEQMRAIQKELGDEATSSKNEIEELEEQHLRASCPKRRKERPRRSSRSSR